MSRRVTGIALLALPILAAGLWLASGREIFTKSGKSVSVPVRDELFGESIREELVRGPILGYYIGLDVVVAVTVVCLIAWGIAWGILKRRAKRTV